MITKDYIYLGLLALAAVVCYCHGFYAGVSRSARIYDALLKEDGEPVDSPVLATSEEPVSSVPSTSRFPFPSFPRRELRNDFGNN